MRDEEFSPLKNGASGKKDTPETARNALYKLHRMYIQRAGGVIGDSSNSPLKVNGLTNGSGNGHANGSGNGHTDGSGNGIESNGTGFNAINDTSNHNDQGEEFVCEISPLVSYDGEGLRGLVEGIRFKSPVVLLSDEEKATIKVTETEHHPVTNGKVNGTNGCMKNGVSNGSIIEMNAVH